MKSHEKKRARVVRAVPVGLLAAASVLGLLLSPEAWGGQRQFLVILANSPKQAAGAILANPQQVRNQYFDTINPNINSFAEYWREISYGDVTISGQVTDWVLLPWPIQPRVPATNFADLDESETYKYGVGERFDNQVSMVGRTNGRPNDLNIFAGASQVTTTGTPVYTPGERFLDVNGDGVWDGFDEATNSMDWGRPGTPTGAPFNYDSPDGRPDNPGPWIDLNGDGVPDNPPNCIYLPDSDNDGNPDCCPNGPGRLGCEGGKPESCPAWFVTGPNGDILDCNGNGIPDPCDISCTSQACTATGWTGACGASKDQVPVSGGGLCDTPTVDGIPDECQYSNPVPDCVAAAVTLEDPCFGKPVCTALTGDAVRTPVPRCEYADVNGNRRLDIVEPFENFLHGVPFSRPDPFPPPNDPLWVPGTDYDAYVTNNYPGTNRTSVVNRKKARLIGGLHDPLGRITDGRQRLCADGLSYRTIGTVTGVCPAGVHAEYDPPDSWIEVGSSKMAIGDLVGISTPEPRDPGSACIGGTNNAHLCTSNTDCPGGVCPSLYEQAWRDRYGNATPPPWVSQTKSATPVATDVRPTFTPDRGGTTGRGSGWIASVDLSTVPILPDELNGVGQPLVLYDGPAEHDDLPSSKYHRAGDQRLGEVTSPFRTDSCNGGPNANKSCVSDPDCPSDATCPEGGCKCVPAIWGEDRGTNDPNSGSGPDKQIPAAGPYATHLYGQLGRDAGNVLQMEWLTWRTQAPFNNGTTWEATYGPHPYAGPADSNFGFRDYNLDGLVDQGEVADPHTENYVQDPADSLPHGSASGYPWNRRRLMEDVIQVLDDVIDFDDFVDPVAMDAVTCPYGGGPPWARLPVPYTSQGPINVAGIVSGIVLLPAGSTVRFDFLGSTSFFDPDMYPIHNEDGLNDPAYANAHFPRNGTPQLNWNLLFHDLVIGLGTGGEGNVEVGGFQAAYAAHEWLHTWERFPDLYDYDIYDQPGPIENCPIGRWDIMADGGLVHPTPILKERNCTRWVDPVDLTTVLTPGVDRAITLPVAEFVRNDSYYFIENEDRLGERFYFWSAGTGFDRFMPGTGMLVLHTDVGSNPDALPPQQRSGDRPTYMIVQADGDNDLLTCVNRGDDGDPWPGSSGNTHFACDTNPASEWYTENNCTGLEIRDIAPDGSGSAVVTFNWTPTSIPSLKFIDPPGGVSVGTPPGPVVYKIRTEPSDVYGGTWIRFFYTTQDTNTPSPATGTLIKLVRKTTPGTNDLSADWNIVGVPDGRYFLFADLIPDLGADGRERKFTTVRAGRNNAGTAALSDADVTVDTSTIAGGAVNHTGTARSETWTIRCVDATAGKWFVSSSLTQPLPADAPTLALCNANPTQCATTGTPYTSIAGAVTFTIKAGAGASPKGAVGDTFTFTTTGITAPSVAVAIRGGQVKDDPTAIIDATPLSGPPPLNVSFDARRSIEPNGQPLTFRWDFGDGATATGAQTSHPFANGGTYEVTLRATNAANGRFGEATVLIQVTNNSPKAVVKATPSSGQGPLEVHFSATQSSDAETAADQLIYQWDYGDGVTANDQGTRGILREPGHTYSRVPNASDLNNCTTTCPCIPTGRLCTTACPCTFTATLKVTDGGGKTDTASTVIRVGNTNPVANVSTTALQGSSPLTVTFNAKNSTDAENDTLYVKWLWGDNSAAEPPYPAKTGKPPATDGSVPHTYTLAGNLTSGSFKPTALMCDRPFDNGGNCPGGQTTWPGVTVTVTTAASGDSDPRAIFCFQVGNECETTTPTLAVDQSFTVDASRSFDNPTGGRISAYTWDWGDGTPFASGVTQTHAYSAAGTYTITLTVADGDSPPHTGRTQKSVVVTQEGGEPPPPSTNHPPSAIFVISPPEAFVGEVVNFDARSSSDPDRDALRYRWVFGDGNQTQFTTNPRTTHTYTSSGSYLVRLTVRDAANASTDATQTVRVLLQGENRTPVAMIATGPRAGTAPLTLTFDGRISYDPDGDAITYAWEFRQNGELMDTMTGSVVTRVFETPGDYTVELVVKDGAGAEGRSEPQSILVTESSAPPPPEPPPPRPEPQEPPDSSGQRPKPTAMCGLGMLPGLLASLAGLTLTVMTRRRLKG